MTRDSMQLPWSVEAVRRTIDGRADSGRGGNRTFGLPKLAIVRVDERIALVMAIRMVADEMALSHKAANNLWMRFCVLADREEGALHTVMVQCVGDP